MYREGEAVPQDAAEAVRWFRLAAEQGNALGQYELGRMYMNGEGVPQDNERAYVCMAQSGRIPRFPSNHRRVLLHSAIVEARDSVASLMTKEQLAEAQRRAREWDDAHPREAVVLE